jgi:hypothetical protein
MAEIRVQERQKSRGWVWVVLLLLVLAAVLYFLWASGTFSTAGVTPSAPRWVALVDATLPSATGAGGLHGTA